MLYALKLDFAVRHVVSMQTATTSLQLTSSAVRICVGLYSDQQVKDCGFTGQLPVEFIHMVLVKFRNGRRDSNNEKIQD